MKILVDENLPPALARSLAAIFEGQHDVADIRDKFGRGARDLDWITALSREGGWIVLSGDRRITRNKAEQRVFRLSTLIGFFFAAGLQKAPLTKKVERLMVLWATIEKQAGIVQGGAMFELQIKSPRLKQL